MTDQSFAGKTVVIAANGEAWQSALKSRFESAGASVVITELAVAQECLDDIAANGGKADVWINAVLPSDIRAATPAEGITEGQFAHAVQGRLAEVFRAAQAAGRHMLTTGQGVIVNVVSEMAYMPIEGSALTSTAEAAIVMLTQALGIEWAKRGVRMVGVAVGPLSEDVAGQQAYVRRSPMHRLGTTAEAVEAIFYVARGRASYIVGETLRVDGGWTSYQLF